MSLRSAGCFALLALISTSVFAADDLGQTLFAKNCVSCHGTDGSGKTNSRTKVIDLRSPQVQSMSNADLYESIARGTRHRDYPHAYEMRGMNKSQIQALVAHIRTFKK